MSNVPAVIPNNVASIMSDVITKGDLNKLTDEQRSRYYLEVCASMNLNPLTKPFDYLTLSGKTVLYATKACTDQLRSLRGISVTRVDARTDEDMRIVEVYATDATGRQDMDMGVTTVKALSGDALANAYMKALTKAKRRVTLSLCGLGMLDESEIESIPDAQIGIVETPQRITGSTDGNQRARSENSRLYESLADRAVAANANRDQEAWKALIKEVGKDVDLWPALIAQSPSETHLAWLEKAANGKSQQLRPHFDRRRAELSALVDSGEVADHDNTADDDGAEVDPATGERIPDWVGRVSEADQLAGMPTPTRGRPSDQIAGIN